MTMDVMIRLFASVSLAATSLRIEKTLSDQKQGSAPIQLTFVGLILL